MRSILNLTLLTVVLFFSACTENSPVIPCLSCDNSGVVIESTDKKVLVEEFTGVRCVNCPAGSAEIESLADVYGDRMIPVSIHAGFFSERYSESIEDYTISEGTALNEFLDFPVGYPTAVVNRKLFDNQDDLQVVQSSWGGLISQETTLQSPLSLDLDLNFDDNSRELKVDCSIGVAEAIDGLARYSVMILETDIKDYQLTPNGVISDYTHKHVLRDMLTPFDGEAIDEALLQNVVIEKSHSMALPANWVADKVSVVVFVHRVGDSREVLQVEEAKIAE